MEKYYGGKNQSFLTLIFSIIVFGGFFFFSEYKEWAIRIGIFSGLFSLYKIYQSYSEPIIKLDKTGIHFQNARMNWARIKKVKLTWKHPFLFVEITTNDAKHLQEKIKGLKVNQILSLYPKLRAFKKKYRTEFQFQKTSKKS